MLVNFCLTGKKFVLKLTGNLTDLLEKLVENFCLTGKISLLKFDRKFD